MEIKPITKTNLGDCVNTFIKAYNSPPWNCQWTEEKAVQYLSELIDSIYFRGGILYDNTKVVGAILGHYKTWWTARQLVIDEFFITPESQHQGYGKNLMGWFEQYANSHQIDLLVLMTNKYLPAYRFYEKVGFTMADQYTFMFKQLDISER
jgi:aminoglycoside 6'-N-acetyltransferase I